MGPPLLYKELGHIAYKIHYTTLGVERKSNIRPLYIARMIDNNKNRKKSVVALIYEILRLNMRVFKLYMLTLLFITIKWQPIQS